VLERFGDQTFDNADDVFTTLRAGVCHRGVGRRFYSDRDPTTDADDGPSPVFVLSGRRKRSSVLRGLHQEQRVRPSRARQ